MSFFTTLLWELGLTTPASRQVANQYQAFAGMDISIYPGDSFMRYFQNVTNIVWTCAYLSAPGHPNSKWTLGAGLAQTIGFGIAPTYFGQQDPLLGYPHHDLQLTTGVTDGLQAVQQAAAMGLKDHSVIYLDWETGNDIANISGGISYCLAWFVVVAEAGFRPSVYAHGRSSMALRQLWPDLFVWLPHPELSLNDAFLIDPRHANVVTRDPRKAKDAIRDPDAIAWQMWYWKDAPWAGDTKFPVPTIAINFPIHFPGGDTAFDNSRHPVFDLDVSSSSTKDPCFPETTVSPGLVRGGKAGAMALSDTSVALFRVRGGELYAVQSAGTAPRTWSALGVDTVLRLLTFHPWSPPRAARRGLQGDLVVVTRSGAHGTPEDRWDIHAYRRRGTTWTVDEAVNGPIVMSPLLGLCPVSRAPDALEVVFQGFDPQETGTPLHLYTVSTRDTAIQADNQPWTAPDLMPVPAGFAPSRVGGFGAVSRVEGHADFFTVAKTTADPVWRLYWATSTAPGSFTGPFAPPISPDPVSKIHPFSNVAAVSRAPNFVDAFAIAMAPNSSDWRVFHWYWSTADGWGASPNFHVEAIGGTQKLPHPMSKLAAVAYTRLAAQCIDVFAVCSADGFLYFTRWNGTAWSDFARIGTSQVTLATVDAAILRAANVIDVVVTGRDGDIYTATSNGDMTGYGALARISKLALGAI